MALRIILFGAIICGVLSCSRETVKNNSIIQGKIPELVSSELLFSFRNTTYKTDVDNTGEFRFDVSINTPKYAFVKGLNRRIFLLPNDSIFIEKQNNRYIFSGGQSAIINNYYTDWDAYTKEISDTANFEAYYAQPPRIFLNQVYKWIEIYRQPLEKLRKNSPNLNPKFVLFENERIKYMLFSDLNDYRNHNKEIPNEFYQYLNNINLNDTNLFQLDEYRYFLTSYVRMQADRLNLKNETHKSSKMLDLIRESFHHKMIINEISYNITRIQTQQLHIDSTRIEKFAQICSNNNYVNDIKNMYNSLSPLLHGKKAPDFELIGLNGKPVTLKDYSGKYLLIDVWSTTCTPCIREFPGMEKIKSRLKGKNIEIIGACLSDETAWKSSLKKHGLTDNQFRINHGWSSQFRRDYLKTSGVPVYILIDTNGRIINARAPKPSENLMELINSLNIK